MFFSVAICTWNRSKLLDQTLAEMEKVRIPQGVDWELLIVNNNCTDDTDAVIAKHSGQLPIRRLFEPKPGHSNARNCALTATKGELLVWTDDDVLPLPSWLEEYVRAAQEMPEVGFFAGPIEPWYEITPPTWIQRHIQRLSGPYPVVDHGSERRSLLPGEGYYGAKHGGANRSLAGNLLLTPSWGA